MQWFYLKFLSCLLNLNCIAIHVHNNIMLLYYVVCICSCNHLPLYKISVYYQSTSIKYFTKLGKLIMLQAVIYYIVTVILTKELVIATDNCTQYQFKTPFSYVGESCEDIYNKNAKSHKWPGYYNIVHKIFCGIGFTGSSCENIFKKYPEIHRNNPKEKSGYYRLTTANGHIATWLK